MIGSLVKALDSRRKLGSNAYVLLFASSSSYLVSQSESHRILLYWETLTGFHHVAIAFIDLYYWSNIYKELMTKCQPSLDQRTPFPSTCQILVMLLLNFLLIQSLWVCAHARVWIKVGSKTYMATLSISQPTSKRQVFRTPKANQTKATWESVVFWSECSVGWVL